MHWFENSIPPPLVAAICALLMWLSAAQMPTLEAPLNWRLVGSLVLLVSGLGVCLAGVASFHQAKTTVNPLKPASATVLVTSGIYRVTRNPMYLGFALVLAAWTVFLDSPFALLGVAAFVLYINRFQILPEERALRRLFGNDLDKYCARVRRWI
ncbi:methyltransferase family protein [Pseudomonas putida]|jgi:protein-S-isoprenylcysteine O-methyltransferase Ste14|uniref:Protein-S-isoprenylcysteine methyltransferase n=1 Tax=Pseudomonas putida TaxID=303 RepID=A0A1L5PVU0_PSEPU|nr:isoprenylcysteine carboxylmethyltransferase family protein [Pseudomonas putida]APO84304.1 protein-S-isoprenylcysteine methyltransferase [Pseudomonas putida]